MNKARNFILLLLLASPDPAVFGQAEVYTNDPAGGTSDDLYAIEICERGITSTLAYISQNDSAWGLTGEVKRKVLNHEQRTDLVLVWSSILDYFAQLDYIMQENRNFYDENDDKVIEEKFSNYYLAFLIQYRYALEFLDIAENNKTINVILNEADPENGLDKNTYKKFKFHFLNIMIATHFVALNAINMETGRKYDELRGRKIDQAVKYIYGMGRGRGIRLTFANAFKIMNDAAFTLWYPFQKGIAEVMADRKVWRQNKYLISSEDIEAISKRLQPGDIILQRREWALTNVGIPGFWTHSAIFIGSPDDRRSLFSGDEISLWVREQGDESGDYEQLLEKAYPDAYGSSVAPPASKDQLRVMEALKPGVVLKSLEKSLTCDGVAVLRPRISNREKAIAIYRAFSYYGRPYDFNFDFQTDSSIVCSELIYKSYEPSTGYQGVTFATIELAGRVVASPNHMARQFDRQYGTDHQQLEFVLFYDGHEKLGKALPGTIDSFRASWARPDWYIFIQGEN